MKFVVSALAFYSNLQTVGRVIVDKNTIAILDSFLLILKGNTLKIVASDGDIVIETEMEVIEGLGDGKFAINARTIQGLLKDIPEQPVTLSVDEETLQSELSFSNGDYQFMAQLGAEYPEVKKDIDVPVNVILPSKNLLDGILHTIFATANDDLRPVMNGIYFDFTPEGLVFVASDTHKLVSYKLPNIQSAEPSSFILPKKSSVMLKSILGKESDSVSISYDSKSASFVFGQYRMTCLLIEGRFPNYRSVIPVDNSIKIVIDRNQMLSALRRINSISEQSVEAGVEIDINSGLINLKAEDINYSFRGKESLTMEDSGVEIRIGFKAIFLIEALSNIQSEHISLELKDQARAGIIRPMDSYDDVELLALIMPMLLRQD